MTQSDARAAKFRQAALVYLHVTVLYEATIFVAWRQGMIHRGPPLAWIIGGAILGAGLSYLMYRWHNPWVPRTLWFLNIFRLPALIRHAFVVEVTGQLAPSFYLTALVVIVANMWMLARAGWDL